MSSHEPIHTFGPPARAREWLRACLLEVLAELRADAAKRNDGTADSDFAIMTLVSTVSVKAELPDDERDELFAFLKGRAVAK